MSIVAIVQARTGSSRLPGKVLKPLGGMSLIGLLLERLSGSLLIDQIVLATGRGGDNDELAEHVNRLGYQVCRGSEHDVLQRFYDSAVQVDAEVVVRITGDCPFVDPALVDQVIRTFTSTDADYASNIAPPSFPDGLDVEVFSFEMLSMANENAVDDFDREHVTPFLRNADHVKRVNVVGDNDHSGKRWTVDEPSDLAVAKNIVGHFAPVRDFTWQQVLSLQQAQPELFTENESLIRNEGASMGEGQKLWKRAKRVIPGGNMLLSKRPEMFLPDQWPSYFEKSKGCRVTDLDGREYIDMSIMGIGTNILGYGHEEVDRAVLNTVAAGNMSTLNCPEEVYLAERLVEIHPWAEMVRFARSGGEANALAIRIARAASGRDKVAICGYHGWHDWYLSANLGDDANLAGHLLPGLDPQGVPQNLRGTVFPFNYNRLGELEQLVAEHPDLGVIKMEVSRNEGPDPGFLEGVRALADKHNIVLIFDECTSGFRETFGGLHKLYGVEPDMAMFGKALGNGYGITATIGRRDVMEAAQTTFISSTFWTERIGPTAALKTLEVMERETSWEKITTTGRYIKSEWQQMAERYGLSIKTAGLPALASFSFDSHDALAYKTLITQEMLAKGYLAGTSVYVSTAHDEETVNIFLEKLDPVFALIADCEQGSKSVAELLKGPVCHGGFKRLN